MATSFSSIRSLSSLVNMFAGSDPTKAQLVPLDINGREEKTFARAFQYFPENITDSKGVNYATKNIPGGSHPLYQFINGTDRTISYTAIFTSDEDPASPDLLSALQGGLEVGIGTLTNAITQGPSNALNSSGGTKHNAPVESAVIWLRSFMYPKYTQDRDLNSKLSSPLAPPVCRMYLPNSGIHGTTNSGVLVVDSVDCIMTQCDVVYDTFYRNGKQRITTVNLTFNETIQTGGANWKFADGAAFNRAWRDAMTIRGSSVRPYNIKGSVTKEINTDSISGKINDFKNSIGSSIDSVKSSIGFG
jgi:hypothetical protein